MLLITFPTSTMSCSMNMIHRLLNLRTRRTSYIHTTMSRITAWIAVAIALTPIFLHANASQQEATTVHLIFSNHLVRSHAAPQQPGRLGISRIHDYASSTIMNMHHMLLPASGHVDSPAVNTFVQRWLMGGLELKHCCFAGYWL